VPAGEGDVFDPVAGTGAGAIGHSIATDVLSSHGDVAHAVHAPFTAGRSMKPLRSVSDGGQSIANGSPAGWRCVRDCGLAVQRPSSAGAIVHCSAGSGPSSQLGLRHGVGVPHAGSVHGGIKSTHSPGLVFDGPISAKSDEPIAVGHSTACGGGGLHLAPFGQL
jgi:hypothetical protein